MTKNPKTHGLINALMANRADTPAPALTLSSRSRGLLGLDRGLGALPSFNAPQPRPRGALEQALASSEHDRLVEKLRSRLGSNLFSDIKVDLPGHVKPDRIVWSDTQRGHEPDASAYYLLNALEANRREEITHNKLTELAAMVGIKQHDAERLLSSAGFDKA